MILALRVGVPKAGTLKFHSCAASLDFKSAKNPFELEDLGAGRIGDGASGVTPTLLDLKSQWGTAKFVAGLYDKLPDFDLQADCGTTRPAGVAATKEPVPICLSLMLKEDDDPGDDSIDLYPGPGYWYGTPDPEGPNDAANWGKPWVEQLLSPCPEKDFSVRVLAGNLDNEGPQGKEEDADLKVRLNRPVSEYFLQNSRLGYARSSEIQFDEPGDPAVRPSSIHTVGTRYGNRACTL